MTYLISDIHAEYDLFMRLLDRIKFSDSDVLISCGDIIEKGNDSVRLLKFIKNMPNARCINGNHEHMFLKYFAGLLRDLKSYPDFDAVLNKLREYFPQDGNLLDWETVFWLNRLPYYIEEDDYVCVHAGVPLDERGCIVPLESVEEEKFVYDRTFKDPKTVVNDRKCVFFGHTPTSYILPDGSSKIIAYRRKGSPKNSYTLGDFYKIHLDTGTWLQGVAGCFCIETCNVYYVKKP